MKITINVTQEHIDAGERGKPQGCPIYLACHTVEPRITGIGLNQNLRNHSFTWNHHKSNPYPLPKLASDAAHHFDCHGAMSPFSFELELPDTN